MYNLWKIKRSLTPDRLFKVSLFKKLSAVWDSTYNVKYAWYQTVLFKHAAGFAMLIVMVGGLGTGAYAYSSPQVSHGSVLYPIKENLENLEENMQTTPEAKAKFYLKKIQRRERELEVVKQKNDKKKLKIIGKQIEQTENRLENTEKDLEEASSTDNNLKIEVKNRIEKSLEKRKQRMEKRLEEEKQNKFKTEESLNGAHQEFD